MKPSPLSSLTFDAEAQALLIPLETSTLSGLLFPRDWLCQLVMCLQEVLSISTSLFFMCFMYFMGMKNYFPKFASCLLRGNGRQGARFKTSCPHKHSCRSSKTAVHFTGQKKLNPIFYLPEKSSQILSPMSGMLLFLCLISTCFCQTMLISSAMIRLLFV